MSGGFGVRFGCTRPGQPKLGWQLVPELTQSTGSAEWQPCPEFASQQFEVLLSAARSLEPMLTCWFMRIYSRWRLRAPLRTTGMKTHFDRKACLNLV